MTSTTTSITGTFRAHPRGFGFLDLDTPLDDSTDSLFVPPPRAKGLLDDDALRVSFETDDRGGAVTKVHEVLARRRYVAGEIDGKGTLQTDATLGDHRLRVPGNPGSGVAVVELEPLDDDGRLRVRQLVAGPVAADTPAATRLLAVTRAATREALGEGAPDEVNPDLADRHLRDLLAAATPTGMKARRRLRGHVPGADLPREDLTELWTVTVDGPSTKDLDDAVSARVTADGNVRVHVHIADVAAHVPIGSVLDRRAVTLATSTYLADHTAPMLPPDLSEDALSLLPGEERDTMTVEFTVVTRTGRITDVQPSVSLTSSDARLTYQDVQRHLDHGDHLSGDTARVVEAMDRAATALAGQRDSRSTLRGLFTPTTQRLVVDGDLIERVDADPYADASEIIERLMVAANESVATWLDERDVPSLYRVHEGVDPTRAERLDLALEAAGIDAGELSEDGYRAGPMAAAMERAGGDDADAVAQTAADAMGRAGYATDAAHHFGLDSQPYTHFTSPIRRVADLLVHRQLRATLAGEAPAYDTADLDELAAWIDVRSGQSARAEALQRSLLWSLWCDAELAAGRRPQLEATIRKLTPAGVLVRIDAYGVAGFVPASMLPKGTLERGRLRLTADGLADQSGRFRVGGTASMEFSEVDESGRLQLQLAA